MSKEELLLLLLSRNDDIDYERITNLINNKVDWEVINTKLIEQSIGMTIYNNISKYNVPKTTYNICKQLFYKTLSHNTLLFNELSQLLYLCNQEKINVFLLKGALLANTIYLDYGMRSLSDVDILVSLQDLQQVGQLLLSLGYTTNTNLAAYNIEKKFESKDISFVKGNCIIEVHWHLFQVHSTHTVDILYFINQGNDVSILGAKAKSFRLEHFLIHLCVHLEKHIVLMRYKLSWFADIILFIKTYNNQIDWLFLQSEAKKYHLEQIVLSILYFIDINIELNIDKTIYKTMHYKPSYLKEQNKRDDKKLFFSYTKAFFSYRWLSFVSLLLPSRRILAYRYASPKKDVSVSLYFFHFVFFVKKRVKSIFRFFTLFVKK